MHRVVAPLGLPGGPSEPCTLADVYPGSNLPPRIGRFLTDSLFWCDQGGETIEFNEPARLHLTPRRVTRRTQQELKRHSKEAGSHKTLDQAAGCMRLSGAVCLF